MTETIISALSGLGIFLFGMLYMEASLKEFAGVKFKQWVQNSTNTSIKAIFTGASATAILQSSSVVTLMTLSFVSASLINLQGAIGLIFGANIGTTATAWIIAILGFKIKIEAFALPMVGFGGLAIMFVKNRKLIAIAKILIGFGLLFYGLDILKTSIEHSAKSIDLAQYKDYSLVIFLLLGTVITAIIQSSSAATAIILSALGANIISFDMATSMVIGTNIGTTATAMLGAIGGSPDKKRVALAHFLFNIITALITFMLVHKINYFILDILQFEDNHITALAVFHTFFNIIGVVVLSPFIKVFANILSKLFTVQHTTVTKYIHLVDPSMLDSALIAVRNEIIHLFMKSIKFTLSIMNIKPNDLLKNEKNPSQIIENNQSEMEFDSKIIYDTLKEIELDTIKYLNKISEFQLSLAQSSNLNILYSSTRESIYAAKMIKDIKNNMGEFVQSNDPKILHYYNLMRLNMIKIIQNLLLLQDKNISYEDILKEHEILTNENQNFVNKLTKNFEKDMINPNVAASLLNTNKVFLFASNAFLVAVKSFKVIFEIDIK